MDFTHLQVRSGYSLMKSTIKIEQLIKRAKELGYDSIALTDENVLYGAVTFYQTCLQLGIKPIIGMTVNIATTNSNDDCILLARTNDGYKNLLKLSTLIQRDRQTVDLTILSEYLDGMIVILPLQEKIISHTKIDQEFAKYLNDWTKTIPSDYFYLGIQPDTNESLNHMKEFVTSNHYQATAIGDVRYLSEKDFIAYDCLKAMKHGVKWDGKAINHPLPKKQYLLTLGEIYDAFSTQWPELINASTIIANSCQVTLDLGRSLLPSFPLPNGRNANDYLKELCNKALHQKYPNGKEAKKRLDYELSIIDSMHFSDYFLIVWDFIRYAKREGIMVGPGRGSAAGSIVAFLLGITNVDPIKYNLLFERFLNPDRISMPDIDVDFSDHRRDEVIAYVREKYGSEHVAQIITFGTFGTRSLVRELIKTMDIDSQDEAYLLKELPAKSDKSIVMGLKSSQQLTDYVKQSQKLKTLFQIATRLEGLPRHISTHAAGVVISEQPLVEHVPLIASNGEMSLSQYEMKQLQSVGLLKMDFLGLRNLTLIENILLSIEQKENVTINMNTIPLNDEQTFSLLQKGLTSGVFQLESSGMQRVLKELIPSSFEDIVAVNALYRPGPMDYIPVYINRKHGLEEITYPHRDLEPILQHTYGVLVYQEQIMQIANKIAGFSLGQADILRRAVSKKQRDEMESIRQSFLSGCIEKGYESTVANEIFEWIIRFSNYGFNRSHAVAYSIITYQLAYLKAHYPTHFFAELLSSVTGNQDKIRMYIKEAGHSHIATLAPSVNRSYGKFTVEGNKIRMGLLSIKGIGQQIVREIIRARKDQPFRHLFDFCLRVPLNIVNRTAIESLILVGGFDETHNNRASLLATIDQAMEQGELFREFDDQPSFFLEQLEGSYIETEPFPQMKQLALERELIGSYLSDHPIAGYRKNLRQNGYLDLSELKKRLGVNNSKSCVVIQTIKTIRTKRGESMAFITIADEGEEMDAVIFPELYRKVGRWIKEEMIVFVEGKTEERKGKVQLLIATITKFDETMLNHSQTKRVFVKISEDNEKLTLMSLKKIAQQFPGQVPVIVYHEKNRKTYQLAVDYFVDLNHACIQLFYNMFGKDRVAVQENK
ncbi:DNA polymerase III subunit alpha [Aquibacillus salsiterrae]|uniref:DNA polymerase III subunit alpha n=1 Tax=Aquibacillus salsiterrae TaxID=2950439 RepID=A0A9X3WE39_9BACI|nr:DNA polymerase III subunit alpha [Aquibacillus salsiterrae]MDC3415754.1 DNA polymerase III subunit alpha [Aquibacillus salsiterrae]